MNRSLHAPSAMKSLAPVPRGMENGNVQDSVSRLPDGSVNFTQLVACPKIPCYLGTPKHGRTLSLSKFDNVDFCSSLAGCAFLTYVERASAEKAQKALHERITLPGVSESLRFLYSSNRNGIYFNYSFRRRPPKHTNSMEKPGMMFWHNFRLYPKQNYIRLSSSVPRNLLACFLPSSLPFRNCVGWKRRVGSERLNSNSSVVMRSEIESDVC